MENWATAPTAELARRHLAARTVRSVSVSAFAVIYLWRLSIGIAPSHLAVELTGAVMVRRGDENRCRLRSPPFGLQ